MWPGETDLHTQAMCSEVPVRLMTPCKQTTWSQHWGFSAALHCWPVCHNKFRERLEETCWLVHWSHSWVRCVYLLLTPSCWNRSSVSKKSSFVIKKRDCWPVVSDAGDVAAVSTEAQRPDPAVVWPSGKDGRWRGKEMAGKRLDSQHQHHTNT